jgi:hypothetical protein
MYVRTHSVDYRCSSCGNRVPAADLEAIYLDQLDAYCRSPDASDLGIQNLHMQWGSLQHQEKRRLIESITERIVAAADEIEITFCQLTSPAASDTPVPAPTDAPVYPATSQPPPLAAAPPVSPAPGEASPKIDPVALAVAMMKDHPDWSARKLAQAAGCSHTTLTRSPLFRTAKALANAKANRHSGWKTAGGDVEAVARGNED